MLFEALFIDDLKEIAFFSCPEKELPHCKRLMKINKNSNKLTDRGGRRSHVIANR